MKSILFCFLLMSSLAVHVQAQDDSSHLLSFKKQIGNAIIIGLGETGHGYESLNEAKSAVTSFLQQQAGFKAIVFESSFVASVIAYLENDSLPARTRNFLYPFWNTASVRSALQNFYDDEKNGDKPLILGFDFQEDCRYRVLSKYLIGKNIISVNKRNLISGDSILSYYLGKDIRKEAMTPAEHELLVSNYDLVIEELQSKGMDTLHKKLLYRSLENRKRLCKYLTLTGAVQKMYYRDNLMANNIIWLQKELYPATKFILWSTNLHVSKLKGDEKPQWTGEYVSAYFADRYVSIGFQKGNGGKAFQWSATELRYSIRSNEKFDMIFYVPKLKKVRPEEWITPCN